MIRILFRLFKKRFIELSTKEIFQNQKKPDYLARAEFVFIDSNGKRYFRYTDGGDIPVIRWAKLQELLALLSMGLNSNELDLIIDFMELSLSQPKSALSQIGFGITELKRRRKDIVHKELMLEMMGVLLIREDQTNHNEVWSQTDEDDKINQFKKDIAVGGLADFFGKARLKEYIPYLESITEELPELLERSERLTTLMNKKVLEYTTALVSSNSAT